MNSFSFGSDSNFNKKLASVFVLPGMCAIKKLNLGTKSYAFYNGGGITSHEKIVFLICFLS